MMFPKFLNLFRRRSMKPLADLSFLIHEPQDVYHAKAKEFLSSHELKQFRDDPYLFWKRRNGLLPEEPERAAYRIGRATHRLILEGRESFEDGYAVGGPVNEKTGEVFGIRTKAYTEWAEAQGKPVLTCEEAALIENLHAAVQSHRIAAELLSNGVPEGVVRADYSEVPCQARLDWLNPERGLIDLKTCDHLRYFEMDMRAYRYVHQLAFYRAVLAQVIAQLVPVHIVAVEKQEPFRCGVWVISEKTLNQAQKENEAAIGRLTQYDQAGVWPTGYEELRTFDWL